jgi:5'-nucleotidase (lipoprotein e(P4) family)
MKPHRLFAIAGGSLLTLALGAGCATSRPAARPPAVAAPAPTPTPAAATVPADDNLNAVLWTQRAVEHDLVFREIYHAAELKLIRALSDPTWDALPRGERQGPVARLAPAVILDVDETVLDNSPYQAMLVRTGKEYGDFSWAEWCRKEAAPPLPGALEFTRFAAEHGVTVYYLTNRTVDLGPATLANLRKAGFPVASDDVFLGLGTVLPGCEMIGTDKGCRRRLIAQDHRVLMQFGDQVGDFVDVVSNTPEGRAKEMEPYADWIGERWWMLPNPTYGSWEPAVFNNDWSQSREKRRKAKIDALRPE